MADMGDRGCWCVNGGTCSSSGLCICPTGFKGTTCQFDTDPSNSVVSRTFEIVIVIATCIFFCIITVFFCLFKWNKFKRRLENEGISLDTLSIHLIMCFLRYISPVELSESRSSFPQSPSGSRFSVLSPLAQLWTSRGNQSLDHLSSGLPVLPVTISPLVTAEV
ncbi:uncharacterized protein LOC117107858 [Anneissia japonica]|uniref:uncharacterized protein LOC117107858 n=1 Tax=Anneissia japonica TaxID=1529436 RepID=UPI001425501F|nr:uncharacterized protein LOC117107858 [Anneissia japonica]XP_033105557.1 uncharacterized protein LOC117107858 [Anneissia japonica]